MNTESVKSTAYSPAAQSSATLNVRAITVAPFGAATPAPDSLPKSNLNRPSFAAISALYASEPVAPVYSILPSALSYVIPNCAPAIGSPALSSSTTSAFTVTVSPGFAFT